MVFTTLAMWRSRQSNQAYGMTLIDVCPVQNHDLYAIHCLLHDFGGGHSQGPRQRSVTAYLCMGDGDSTVRVHWLCFDWPIR